MFVRTMQEIGTVPPGPLLVFGGPYSNLQATRAIRQTAKRLGIAPERCICTGDIVGYCADPMDTIAEIRDWGCHVIAGNVERQLAEGALDCGCGFDAGTTCDRLAAGWYTHANAHVDRAARDWMAGLPDVLRLSTEWGDLYVVHGGTTHVNRFVWPTATDGALLGEIGEFQQGLAGGNTDPAAILAGHSGIAFRRDLAGTAWINAGVIGLPPNDGAPATRYCILYPDGRSEIGRLDYDFEAAASAMEAAGLTQGYHRALRSGWWPSEDILPPDLRRQAQSLASG
ncbi:metallophosphoesterase family protein [Tropicibacter oceani]|uniref:Metallophosphoesterase family protein n=1 Tax=Tropicibacter oceani TaxID=3058420 RepID=A0ABY8QE53_9RHOB|nr:metallophosphoesterase family protein [Tropicibacter oceani]WGW02784.1 metallophosphoesterase family protein [Tropicibacter oceani]